MACLHRIQQRASSACKDPSAELLKGTPEGIWSIGRALHSPRQQAAVCEVACAVGWQVGHGSSAHAGEGTDDLTQASEQHKANPLNSTHRAHLPSTDVVEQAEGRGASPHHSQRNCSNSRACATQYLQAKQALYTTSL